MTTKNHWDFYQMPHAYLPHLRLGQKVVVAVAVEELKRRRHRLIPTW
jgi:hypothetical protein